MGRRHYVALSVLVAAGAGVRGVGSGRRPIDGTLGPIGSLDHYPRWVRATTLCRCGHLELANCIPKDASGVKVGTSLLIDSTSLRPRSTGCTPFPLGKSLAITEVHESSLQNIWNCRPDSLGAQAIRKGPGGSAEPVGPVLFGYSGTCSHTAPLTAYGGDSLWVRDSTSAPVKRLRLLALFDPKSPPGR